MKKYLRLGDPQVVPTEYQYVGELREAIHWVAKLEEATLFDRESAESTQSRLATQQNLETKLVEVPDNQHLLSRWAVSRELQDQP